MGYEQQLFTWSNPGVIVDLITYIWAVIWFSKKTAWRKLWSCRCLKCSFGTHFCIDTKQWNRLDYLWITNAKIYKDSVSQLIVLWVWIINEEAYCTHCLVNDANCCGFSGVRWAAHTQAKQIGCVDLFEKIWF